ncbi:MAG: hypothetical protein U0514_00545 [Candidatus Andersenbacteria bacterium]
MRKSAAPKRTTRATTTLVLDPTSARAWVGLWSAPAHRAGNARARFLWRTSAPASGPGAVNFWPPLLKHRRALPPDRILVLDGPGPFSATRAAVNIANALAYAWNIPVIGVHGPATAAELAELLRDLDQTKIAPRFEIERRALPFWPKRVQLGRQKSK